MVACRLTLLGGFILAMDDGRPLPLPTRKDRLLLAYLALSAGRALPREGLAGLLWADRAEAQARDSLKQSLAGIRQAFRQARLEPLRADRETVALAPDGIEIDALEFARLAGASSTPDRAAALYRGELLEGVDGAGIDFQTWLRAERARLEDLAVRILEQLARCAAPDRIDDDWVRLGRHLLARDALRESVYRSLMRLSVLKGDRAEALKLYAACRDALKRDLGVAPDIATEDLYRDILTGRVVRPSDPSPVAGSADRPSIAVLPLSNLSGDAQLGQLCDGLTEDIITGLGRFHFLFVIDRHSSIAMSQQTADLAEIGHRLGVTHLVQGSLQRLGKRVRITVRLVDAASRAQRWGDAYDVPLSEFLALSDKVTGALVSTLYDRVERSLLEQSRRKPTLVAYECLIRGIAHLRGYAPDDNRLARELFERAISLDSNYALAHAYLAMTLLIEHGFGDASGAIKDRALDLAHTAVRLDSQENRCHWFLAQAHLYRAEFDRAMTHFERSIALNPNDANCLASMGLAVAFMGRAEEGIGLIRQAMRLNPFHPDWYWDDLTIALYAARRYEEALESSRVSDRTHPWALARVAACYAQLGRLDEAHAKATAVLRLNPNFHISEVTLLYKNPVDAEHVFEGMRKAGLPE